MADIEEDALTVVTSLSPTDYIRAVRNPGGAAESVNIAAANILPAYGVFRNLLVNGDMAVAQRGTSFAGLTAGQYVLDRWAAVITTLGTHTISQDTDVPTGYGFRSSLKVLVTTADAAPAAADVLQVSQRIEGRNLQTVRKGTANARPLVVTFWVKSNLTGTYIVDLLDNDNTRQCSKSYTISAANTWEQKTLTFPADTTGAFDNDVNLSLYCNFWLGAGSNFTSGTLNTSWAANTAANRAVGQVNLAGTINNYINITGVQLEVSSATEFEFVPWDIQHNRCKRYYQKSFLYGTTPVTNAGVNTGDYAYSALIAGASSERAGFIIFQSSMRGAPTVTIYNPAAANNQVRDITASADCSSTTVVNNTENGFTLSCVGNAGTAVGNRLGFHWTAEVEL